MRSGLTKRLGDYYYEPLDVEAVLDKCLVVGEAGKITNIEQMENYIE